MEFVLVDEPGEPPADLSKVGDGGLGFGFQVMRKPDGAGAWGYVAWGFGGGGGGEAAEDVSA